MSSSAQLIMRQAETVKTALTDPSKGLSELWGPRQKLEDLYKQLLLHDLEYALDKKVEQELWNHAFKNQISTLQIQAKDRMSLKKMEARANLNLFLEMASGSYLQFLQMICSTFKLDLPFRRRSSVFGITNENRINDTSIILPKKSSCLYICCHCLVHLGDIARYLQQIEQAQNYYRHAANLSPNNGQPYNQLAILEASRGDKLSTVFYYIRSLAVRHPFPVAATNLEKLYSKLVKDVREFDNPNLSVGEITVAFLQFQALLHMSTNFDRASGLRAKIVSSLASHIRAQTLTAAHLTGILAITIFALHRARHDFSDSGEPVKKTVFSKDEEQCVQLHISFFGKLLEILVQHTPKEDAKVKDFLTLPTIKVSFDWLSLNKDILKGREFLTTSLWQELCKLLNILQWLLNDNSKVSDPAKYAETPLPEDNDLRCFQPLDPAYSQLNFASTDKEELSAACERDLRCHRLVAHGKWIAQEMADLKLIIFQPDKSIRTQFSSQKTAGPPEPPQPTPTKSGRQNVAMQTILKKQMERKAEEEKNAVSPPQEGKTKTTPSKADSSTTTSPASGGVGGSGGSSGGRQGGVIPVHHKGGTFKPNLPPRLSGKNKSQPSVSPRLQAKNDNGNFFTSQTTTSSVPPMTSRNKINTITTTAAQSLTAVTSLSSGNNMKGKIPPQAPPVLDSEVEYPKLTTDNYPKLISQKSPASLTMPNPSSAMSPVGQGKQSITTTVAANTKSGWGSFGVGSKIDDSTPGDKGGMGISPMSSGVSGAATSVGDAFSSLYPPHQPSSSTSPNLSSYIMGSEGGQKVMDDSTSKIGMQAPGSGQGYASFSMQGPVPFLTATSGNPPHQMNPLLQRQQQQQQQQQHQQHQHQQQQQQFLQQQQSKLNDLLKQQQMQQKQQQHSHQQSPQQLQQQQQQQQKQQQHSHQQSPQQLQQQQQQQFPRFPSPAMGGTMDYFSHTPSSMKYDMKHHQQQQQHQQQQPSQMFGNPAASLLSGIQDPNLIQQQGLFPNSAMTGGQSSSYNPQALMNQKQQQQHQMYPMRGMDVGVSKSPSGLLYKNIPLPGNARSHMTGSEGSGSGMSSSTGGMATAIPNKASPNQMQGQSPNQMRGHQGSNMIGGQGASQMQTPQALTQLLAMSRGASSQSGLTPADLFRSPSNFQSPSKPDLMGLQPPPSFLEHHQQDRGYKSSGQPQHQPASQQPSFLNTMMDPSFLHSTGEYSLFNNNNSNNNSGSNNNNNNNNNNNSGWPSVTAANTPSHGSMGSGVRGSIPISGRSSSGQGELNPSLQSLWQNTGPSPLERLLEQQRHQRHNDG